MGNVIIRPFTEALLESDYEKCSALAKTFLQNNTIEELYENVLKISLYDIGKLWEFNKISVAEEHMASSIVELLLNEYYDYFKPKTILQRTIILSCIQNEYHQIGIKMINDVFEMNGWKTFFLGANTPNEELIRFSKEKKPDLIALSLSIYFNLPNLIQLLTAIKKELPEIPILIGGQAFMHGGIKALSNFDKLTFELDINSTIDYIKKFEAHE